MPERNVPQNASDQLDAKASPTCTQLTPRQTLRADISTAINHVYNIHNILLSAMVCTYSLHKVLTLAEGPPRVYKFRYNQLRVGRRQ
jgi:hypothetical protein